LASPRKARNGPSSAPSRFFRRVLPVVLGFSLVAAGSSVAQAQAAPQTSAAAARAADPNPAPRVVPALQQWTGSTGSVVLSRHVVVPAGDSALRSIADQVVTDAHDLFGEDWQVSTAPAGAGDVVLALDAAAEVGPDAVARAEGYRLDIADTVGVTARTTTGVFWGTRSLLQARLGSDLPDHAVARGNAVDWPNYAVRGYMYDLGRRWMDPSYTRDYIRLASWFKLNTIQLHLNDNAISPPTGKTWADAYSGFRLKTDNPALSGLASTDGAFTRADWDNLEDLAAANRVTIIPEIDAPAHSLAFIKFKPSVGLNGGNSDHLDLSKPETTAFMESVWDEFLPWFRSPVVHFGADEYPKQYVAQYQKFFNDMASHLRSKGKQVRAWGSFTAMSGNDVGYDKDVSINSWNNGYYSGASGIADGRQIINSNDGLLYTVPFAGYYHGNGLDGASIYANWEPNIFGSGNLAVKAPGLLGGIPAVWNDLVDKAYTPQDVFSLLEPSWAVLAQKMWGGKPANTSYSAFMTQVIGVGTGPKLESLATTIAPVARPLNAVNYWPLDETGNQVVDVVSGKSVELGTSATRSAGKAGGALTFPGTGGVTLGQEDLPGPWTVGMWVKRTADTSTASLLSGAGMALKLEQYPSTHKVGMTVFGASDANTSYVSPLNQWVYLTFVGNKFQTEVYADGQSVGSMEVGSALGRTYLGQILRNASTDPAKAVIDDVIVYESAMTREQVAKLYQSADVTRTVDGVSITVTRAGTGPVDMGDSVQLTATVKNTGITALDGVSVTGLPGSCIVPALLPSTGQAECTFTATASPATVTGGKLVVSAAVSAHRLGGTTEVTSTDGVQIPVNPATGVAFVDVPESNQFHHDIQWLAERKIATGTVAADGVYFKPGEAVSRQAFAAFLYRLDHDGGTAPACTTAPYVDVPKSATFCGEIAWLKNQGITTGFDGNTFKPGAAIERQAMAAFLFRHDNPGATKPTCTGKPFTDVPVGSPFCGEIAWMKTEGVTTGFPDGTFHPGGTVQRQAVAAFLHRSAG